MAPIYQNIGHLVLMLLLLAGSAFFSGSETAFFNLSRRQISQLGKSGHKLQHLVAELLGTPRYLLGCLLFGNMAVNVLFFAVASVFTVRVESQVGVTVAAVTAGVSFCLLVLFGEILPKSLAYSNSKAISITAALPAFLCLKVFRPVLFVFRVLMVEPVLRLLLGHVKPAKPMTTDEFKSLIEQVRKRGLITADENKLLTEIVELGFLKVRDCLRPRVDMIACGVKDSNQQVREIIQENNLTKLPVYIGEKDNIVGIVSLRQLLLYPDKPIDRLVQQIHFVPEQKTVESLLQFFREKQIDTAAVVDEYGGISGLIALEDIVEELLGPIEIEGEIEPIEQIGPFEYRLAGNLAIHEWVEVFGIDAEETRISTIAGLVTAILGKIPKAGDVAYLKNLKFTVERVKKHRIESLILTFEQIKSDG